MDRYDMTPEERKYLLPIYEKFLRFDNFVFVELYGMDKKIYMGDIEDEDYELFEEMLWLMFDKISVKMGFKRFLGRDLD